jgi:hypothetical protein
MPPAASDAWLVKQARYRRRWTAPGANPFDGSVKRCACGFTAPRASGDTWKRNPGQYDGLDHRCLTCRQDDAAHATATTKAIARSLVTLFGLLPDDGWRRQLAQEIRESNSCQTLTWASGDLEAFVVEYSGEEGTG